MIPLHEEPGSPGAYRGTLDTLALGYWPRSPCAAAGTMVGTSLAAEGHPDPVEQIITVDPAVSTEMNGSPLQPLPRSSARSPTPARRLLSPPPASLKNAMRPMSTPSLTSPKNVVSREALWDRWIYLWLFIAFVAAEWLARKYWRMV